MSPSCSPFLLLPEYKVKRGRQNTSDRFSGPVKQRAVPGAFGDTLRKAPQPQTQRLERAED